MSADQGCGHPNHGNPDHDCEPFVAAGKDAPMCTCGHRWWRHQDSNLSPECLDCDCAQFEELTPVGWLVRWTARRGLMGAEHVAWGERPEDVLLCTHQEELGHCSLHYGHGGRHVLPSAEKGRPNAQ